MNQKPRQDQSSDQHAGKPAALTRKRNPLAAAAGLSDRQWWRLMQDAKAGKDDTIGYQLSAKLIGALGHPELLTPQGLDFFHEFVIEFIKNLSANITNDGSGMDPRWAKAQARKTIEAFQIAVERRQKLMDLQDTEVLRGFGVALSAEIASDRCSDAGK